MCTQCRGELSVNEAFKFLQQYSENVMTDNLLSLQRVMVELNFLLKSAKRCVETPTWQQPLYHTAHLLPLSAQYSAPFTDSSNGLHQSKRRESVTFSAVKL
jgi:hypothetical protein